MGTVCSIEEISGLQNLRVSLVEASKSAGAKGDVPKIYKFVHLLHPCQRTLWMIRSPSIFTGYFFHFHSILAGAWWKQLCRVSSFLS